MTDTKRIKECKRKIIAAINEAKIPFAVSELVLENVLAAVRENMAAEEAAEASIEIPKTEEENRRIKALRGNAMTTHTVEAAAANQEKNE